MTELYKYKIFSVISILFKFHHQVLPGMWRGNLDYLLWLRIRGLCGLGRSETVVLRHAEGNACSWASSAPWLRYQNAERWRRDKRWYRDVSRRNVSTAWTTISIFCKILRFILHWNFANDSFFQVSFGSAFWPSVPEYIDELIEALIAKRAPFVRLTAAFHVIYDSSLLLNQLLACGAPNAKLSEQQAERIKSSGLGMMTKWSPQHFVLNHPVLHFPIVTCPGSILKNFYRQLDGSLHMEVLIVLPNLLRAVSPCKGFFPNLTHHGNLPFFLW